MTSNLDQQISHMERKSEELEKQKQKVKDQLYNQLEEIVEDELVTSEVAQEIKDTIDQEDFDTAREIIAMKKEEAQLFDEEDKQIFVEAYEDSWKELTGLVEEIRNQLLDLQDGASEQDLKQYLYGKKASRPQKDVDQVFKAIDTFKSRGLSDRTIARVLTGFNNDLTISQTEEVLGEIREKVE